MKINSFSILSVSLLISGCLSTYKGDFACGLPNGVLCEPMDKIYQRVTDNSAYPSTSAPAIISRNAPIISKSLDSGQPLRSSETVYRIWIAPYTEGNTFYDQRFIYEVVSGGNWLFNHNESKSLKTAKPSIKRSATSDTQMKTPSTQNNVTSGAGVNITLPENMEGLGSSVGEFTKEIRKAVDNLKPNQ
jgi:hypothetical protein